MNAETTPKVLEVGPEKIDPAPLVEKMLAQVAAIETIPEAERSARQRSDLMLMRATLRRAKKAGLVRMGPSSQPRPTYERGEELVFDGTRYWVEKAKADGRLRLIWSGHHHPVGTWMHFKGVAYIVTAAGPRLLMLRIASDADLEAEKDALSAPVEFARLKSADKEAAKTIVMVGDGGLSASQLARRERKANRARGRLERRMKAAAGSAPLGSIGAALHSGGY